jgi:uncharacterized protein (DUF934 family)
MPTLIDLRGAVISSPTADTQVLVLAPESDPLSKDIRWEGITRVDIAFPNFTDGRGYSIARILRTRLQFKGDIRATGDVLVDQLSYMARCGFTSFALRDDQSVNVAKHTLLAFSLSYQSSHPVPV